jgi:hypothetical protein
VCVCDAVRLLYTSRKKAWFGSVCCIGSAIQAVADIIMTRPHLVSSPAADYTHEGRCCIVLFPISFHSFQTVNRMFHRPQCVIRYKILNC